MQPEVQMKEQRPSYVMFESRPIEDRAASMKEGRYMTKDAHYAIVTPIGSKDRIPRLVSDWFPQLEQQAKEGRIPAVWVQHYKEAYEAWKRGEAVPLRGTPIKGWALLSPSQQANIISANVLTVEDLAQANDEARKRIGMGANEMVDKALAWLKAAKDLGPLAQENASLKATLGLRDKEIERLNGLLAQLKEENEVLRRAAKLDDVPAGT